MKVAYRYIACVVRRLIYSVTYTLLDEVTENGTQITIVHAGLLCYGRDSSHVPTNNSLENKESIDRSLS